jgi:hypothetical protein
MLLFPDTEKYFSNDELGRMLNDFWEFDAKRHDDKSFHPEARPSTRDGVFQGVMH